jgi:predicted naringenin-chalcone synthase
VAECLGLGDGDLAESRGVLAQDGNCSSATVLLVLEEVRRRPLSPGGYVVALAFGPGLTLYATLLRVR